MSRPCDPHGEYKPMNATAQHQFTVTGMSCQHCVKAVTEAIRSIDPEAIVSIDLTSGSVVVATQATSESLANAIRHEGYGITP